MVHLPYKFPRLANKYNTIVAVRDSKEEAEKAAEERMHWERIVKKPLHMFFHTYDVQGGRFETTLYYLHPKFEAEFNEPERRRHNGLPAQILFVDNDEARLEEVVDRACALGIYEVGQCNGISDAKKSVALCLPEVMVLRCADDAKETMFYLGILRKQNLYPKTIVHGSAEKDIISVFFHFPNVYYFVRDINNLDIDGIMRAISKTIQGIRPAKFEEFSV